MSSPGLARVNSQDHPLYWTDDIPVCFLSAVGLCNNQIYRDNAPSRREEHECEDSSFRFKPDSENEIYLYGVFDGHDGSKLSNFAAQRFPAEILLGQLTHKINDDEEVLNVLHQAFVSVEKAYLDSISDQLAEKCNLKEQLPVLEGDNSAEAMQLFEDVNERLDKLELEIAGGTSAVLALIIKHKLYVACVGCCRPLLCKADPNGTLRVHQLSVDHDLNNGEELHRLADLGLDVEKIRTGGNIGNHPFTRTLGDYNLKIGYKDIEYLSTASSDPVISEPEMSNAIDLDDSCSFLILMSSGVYKSLEDAGTTNVNVAIASMVASEFAVQSTLSGVAQGVVDKIGRIHHDTFMTSSDYRRDLCQKREDMTLLLRNFNYPMPNSINSPTSTTSPSKGVSIPYLYGQPQIQPLSVMIPTHDDTSEGEDHRPMFTVGCLQGTDTIRTNTMSSSIRTTYTSSNDSTQSGEESGRLFSKKSQYKNPLPLNEDGRITAYVDFNSFYEEFDKMTDQEKEAFGVEAEPKPAYETIPEEKEMLSPSTSSPQPLLTDNIPPTA